VQADVNGVAAVQDSTRVTKSAPSVYVSAGSKLPGWDTRDGTWDTATGNFGEDPLFIAGYYLSQRASGQTQDSPAVEAGSGQVEAPRIALSERTTRTDGTPDAGLVDLGYHYSEGVTLYKLEAEVLPDPNDGQAHGTVTPTFALVYEGSADNLIRLEAEPEDGWRIAKWTGTDDDTSTDAINYVTLTEDRRVTVTFRKRTARVVSVPADYTTIQGAVSAAEDGDTIMVDPGVYYSEYNGIALIVDKSVTVVSRNPTIRAWWRPRSPRSANIQFSSTTWA
jgi:hypothetical protein